MPDKSAGKDRFFTREDYFNQLKVQLSPPIPFGESINQAIKRRPRLNRKLPRQRLAQGGIK